MRTSSLLHSNCMSTTYTLVLTTVNHNSKLYWTELSAGPPSWECTQRLRFIAYRENNQQQTYIKVVCITCRDALLGNVWHTYEPAFIVGPPLAVYSALQNLTSAQLERMRKSVRDAPCIATPRFTARR